MNKVYIIYESSGSYDTSYKGIHEIYSDENVAKVECDRLNQELKAMRDRRDELADDSFACKCYEGDEPCALCNEYDDLVHDLQEQWDYVVEGVDME